MSKVGSKMIIVTSRGVVTTSRGKVQGPIRFPYRETVDKIWNMLTVEGATIQEQLLDKTFIQLTTQNFDENNNQVTTATEIHNAVSNLEPKESLTGTNVGELNANGRTSRRNKKRGKKNKNQQQSDQTTSPTNVEDLNPEETDAKPDFTDPVTGDFNQTEIDDPVFLEGQITEADDFTSVN